MRKMATLLLAAAFGMACSSDDSVVAPDGPAADGIYTMQSIDGQQLPYLIYQQDTTTITVLASHLYVVVDGSWTEKLDFRVVSGTDTTTQTATGTGPWYRSGTSLLFIYGEDNSMYYTGTLSANRLDLSTGIVSVVYTK